MMGVYIKGMDMPKDGEVICVFSNGKVQKRIVQFSTLYEIIEASAVIPVPDHGRLGDLDKLESGLRLCAKYQTGYRQQGMLGCCETIRTAPTIIPADKKETE